MKVCTKCHIEKEESEFHNNATKKDGLCVWCIPCNIKGVRDWEIKNRERKNDKHRKYRRNNKEKDAARKLKYAQNNRDKMREMEKRRIENCNDGYIKKRLRENGFSDIEIDNNPDLILAKRQIILLKRKIKNYGKEKKANKQPS